MSTKGLIVFSLLLCLGAAAQVNMERYPFSVVLFDQDGQYYSLHWNFQASTQSIYFAVNVSTTGWVGLGLSPNGQMPGSDVVIGWVSDTGEGYFHDRFAEGRFLPPVDTLSQDWFLTNSEEENGFTLLEFSRNFTSCDPQDLDITTSTARVIWSYSTHDPTEPSGAGARRHDYQGARSINLIGGTTSVNAATLANENFLDFTVQNVTIPEDSTTYWCETFNVPSLFQERPHYINRYGPSLTSHDHAYVHHIIVYECFEPIAGKVSMPCDDLTGPAAACRASRTLGAWAVGGEDFYYPEGIAYAISGTEQAMIEMHYDNPDNIEGVVDSSGMRFYYTTEEPEHLTGSITIGHNVDPDMLIPPRARNYTITAICPMDCTSNLPEDGVRVFGNFFHTHLAGRGLVVQHYRYNQECGVLEELEPIDQNLRYDFNYQQTTILPKERVILPGDVLVLKCFYETTDRSTVVQGGESTREEMCLSALSYYPKPAGSNVVEACVSIANKGVAYRQFRETLAGIDPVAAERLGDPEQVVSVLNGLDWQGNPGLETALEESVTNSNGLTGCLTTSGEFSVSVVRPLEPGCSYEAADTCSRGPSPLPCCERVTAGAVRARYDVALASIALFLLALIMY